MRRAVKPPTKRLLTGISSLTCWDVHPLNAAKSGELIDLKVVRLGRMPVGLHLKIICPSPKLSTDRHDSRRRTVSITPRVLRIAAVRHMFPVGSFRDIARRPSAFRRSGPCGLPPSNPSFCAATVLALSRSAVDASRPEVRRLVTFLFQPGRSADAIAIYEQTLKPIYADVAPLKRFCA